jgi:Asp-tRNA(Asn)/Glu-tRNA(Gln) amidotransferase C subunit
MALNKPTLELKRHLKGTATNLETTANDILKLAEQMEDVDVTAILQLVNRLYSDADQLKAYADEVKAKRIVRAKAL